MAPIQAPCLYTETRLDLDEASPGSTIELVLPSSNASIARRSPNRHAASRQPQVQDENAFAKQHLTTEASVFFRRPERSPRVFLWRILDSRTVLELQAIDLSQDRSVQGDAVLTLQLRFPRPLRPFGVAFADPDERDALCVFALTDAGDLYTLTIRREMFVKVAAAEADMSEWCKVFQPSAFSFQLPYRLFAISALELVVSLHNGGMLRLMRRPGDDGTSWRDSYFNEGSWGSSFKHLLPFQGNNRVRFDDLELEPNTTSQVALSPDGKHFAAVGLDHNLRLWNATNGRIGVQTDVLGDNTQGEKEALFLSAPEQKQVLQVIDGSGQDGILYYVVTYSAKTHQFKIWGILDADSGFKGLRDVRDDVKFIPPLDELMDASVWSLEEFHIDAKSRWRESEIWLRARSGPVSKVFNLRFDLFAGQKDLQQAWRANWTTVDGGYLSTRRLSSQIPAASVPIGMSVPPESSTEQWIEFLFHPGRFSASALRTALHVYSQRLRRSAGKGDIFSSQSSTKPLKQEIVDAILRVVQTATTNGHNTERDNPEAQISQHWRLFYGLVQGFEKRRTHSLSLAYDSSSELPWLVCSDYVSAIRECCDVEVMQLNPYSMLSSRIMTPSHPLAAYCQEESDVNVARLLQAAHILSSGFQVSFRRTLRAAVSIEVYEEPSEVVFERMEAFDERIGLCAQVKDDDYTRLTEALQDLGGYTEVDNNIFFAALEKLGEQIRGIPGRLAITRYGAKALVRGSQETLQLAIDVMLDLLSLVIFLGLELEAADLSPQFDPQMLYVELITQLKEHCLLDWFATTMRPNHNPRRLRKRSSSVSDNRSSLLDSPENSFSHSTSTPAEIEANTAQTVMESMFIGDWAAIETPQGLVGAKLLTYWCRSWTYGSNVSENYDELTAHVLSHLLKSNDIEIAREFERFVPMTPWSSYIKARLALAQGNLNVSATLFKKCSFGLALSHFDVHDSDKAGLLALHEQNSFTDGLLSYYSHVMDLFEKVKAHSYVVDFANLALQSAGQASEVDVAADVEDDVRSKLFMACMATSRFEEAYSTLNSFRKEALWVFYFLNPVPQIAEKH